MKQNLFLHLCQQAERNQSYALAKYLTWRSYQRPCGYHAGLWGDGEDLKLIAFNDTEEFDFDLSEVGKKMAEEEEAKAAAEEAENQANRLAHFLNNEHTVEEALDILTTDYEVLWDDFGDEFRSAIDLSRSIVDPAIDGSRDDYNPSFPNNNVSDGYIVNGRKYRLNYSGVAGHYWNSEWELWW